jgi:circadian clock protein KaiC
MATAMKSTPSGIPGLDAIIGGGLPVGRPFLVAGAIGTGKTTLGVQFLVAGAQQGERGVLIAVDEKPRHIVADMRGFGWVLDGPAFAETLTVLDASPYFTAMRGARKPDAAETADAILEELRRLNARRLVIDEVTSLVPGGADARRSAGFFAVLVSALERAADCTTILTAASVSPAEQFTAGAVELSVRTADGPARRVLTVRDMPGQRASLIVRPFDIVDGRGLVVGES